MSDMRHKIEEVLSNPEHGWRRFLPIGLGLCVWMFMFAGFYGFWRLSVISIVIGVALYLLLPAKPKP